MYKCAIRLANGKKHTIEVTDVESAAAAIKAVRGHFGQPGTVCLAWLPQEQKEQVKEVA